MCDTDIETHYELFDRVITVRLGTGVPLGTRGTVIGVMHGQTHVDAFYEILFDQLPKNSLETVLLAGSNQQRRIKVRSYHLLNYSHSLRVRSMANLAQSRSMPNENAWEKRLLDQSSAPRQTPPQQQQQPQQPQQQQQQQPTRILKRTGNDSSPSATPKTTPASTSKQDKPNFVETLSSAGKTQPPVAVASSSSTKEKPKVPQPTTAGPMSLLGAPPNPPVAPSLAGEKLLAQAISAATIPVATGSREASTAPVPQPDVSSLLFRAIQESIQTNTNSTAKQSWNPPPAPSLPSIPPGHTDLSALAQHAPVAFPVPPQQPPQPNTWQSPLREPSSGTPLTLSSLSHA